MLRNRHCDTIWASRNFFQRAPRTFNVLVNKRVRASNENEWLFQTAISLKTLICGYQHCLINRAIYSANVQEYANAFERIILTKGL